MKVAKDTFLIRVESDRNADIGIAGSNGEKIIIDTDYNKYKHTAQIGKIFACPITITEQYGYDVPLKIGDTVIFHHFVCQPDHKIDIERQENIYRAEYFHLYGKLFGGTKGVGMESIDFWRIEPLEDIIFVEPILEEEANLYAGNIRIKTHQENLKQTGIVFALSKRAKEAGIQEGDKVFFTSNADYNIKIIDKELYRMRIRNICAIERDSKLVCPHNKIQVIEHGPENKSGNFIDVKKSTQMKGVVDVVGKSVKGVVAGQEISYFHGSLGSMEYKEKMYAFLETRNINYIIK